MHGVAVGVEFGGIEMAVAVYHGAIMSMSCKCNSVWLSYPLMLMDNTLETNWVLERSDIGQAEIATRALKLPMSVRAVLLMVDGKSEISQLQRKMAGLPDAMSILESLLANGLIRRRHYSGDATIRSAGRELATSAHLAQETLRHAAQDSARIGTLTQAARGEAPPTTAAVPPRAPAPAAPASAPAPVGKQRRSLGLARMYLLDQMERMFGDRSEAARNLLRTATTREELLAIFTDCRDIFVETAGSERALRIEMEFRAILPEAVSS